MELLQEIAISLRELTAWTKVIGRESVRRILEEVLDSDEKRRVYQSMDGQSGVAEIQERTGVNVRFISEWGQEWEAIGIARQSRRSKVRGRRERVFDLDTFGVSISSPTASHVQGG